jgi:hypothetical protein
MAQASLGGPTSIPPQPGRALALRNSALLTAAWIATDVVNVGDARRLTLFCAYTATSTSAAAYAQIRVMGSCENDPTDDGTPDVADDVWYSLTATSAEGTSALIAATKETGATATITQPEHLVYVVQPQAITLGQPADADTDVVRLAVTLDVSNYRWIYVAAREAGDVDAGDLGTLAIKYSLSV